MALNFPSSPSNGQLYVADNGVTYVYNAGRWAGATQGNISGQTDRIVAGSFNTVLDSTSGNLTLPGNLVLNGAELSVVNGNLYVNGSVIHGGGGSSSDTLTNGSVTAHLRSDGFLEFNSNISGITANDYNSPNLLAATYADTNWAFGFTYDGAAQFFTQATFYGQGDDQRGFKIKDNSNSNQWVFGGSGALTLPGGSKLFPGGNNIDLIAGPGGWAELQSFNADSYVWVDNAAAYIGTGWTTTPRQWTFANTGALSVPSVIQTNQNTLGPFLDLQQYDAQLVANANVTIRSSYYNNVYDWNFDEFGRITFPDGTIHTGSNIGNLWIDSTTYTDLWLRTVNNNNIYISPDDINALFVPKVAENLTTTLTGYSANGLGVFTANAYISIDDASNTNTGNIKLLTSHNNQNYSWTFDLNGNLHLPTGIDATNSVIQSANGIKLSATQLTVPSTVISDGLLLNADLGEAYAFLSLPANRYANTTAARLGNDNGNVQISTVDQSLSQTHYWTFDTKGNITFPDSTVQTTAYSNAAVSTYLSRGNIANISVAGNVTATYFVGNGALLTGIVASGGTNYSNVNVQAYTETMGFKNYSNVNVAAYLTTNNYLTSASANLSLYAWNGNVSGGSNYGNSNVASYLTSYTGNVQFGNVISLITGSNPSYSFAGYTTTGFRHGTIAASGDTVDTLVGGTIINRSSVGGFSIYTTGSRTNPTLQIGAFATMGLYTADTGGTLGITAGGTDAVRVYSANTASANTSTGTMVVVGGLGVAGQITTANIKLAPSGNIVFADGTVQTTATVNNNYGNVNVAAYLNTQGYNLYSNVNVAAYLGTGQVTVSNVKLAPSGNIVFADGTVQTTAASGGSNYGNGNVASYLITNGYVNTNSAYANANVTSYLPTHTGNVGVNNILGTSPNVTLVANSYSTTFDIYGNVAFGNAAYPVQIYATGPITTTSNVIVGGMGVAMPNRPAFRINGQPGPTQATSNVNIKSPQITVAYNQGNYFNATTGQFVAPVAGIYQVGLVARVGLNNGLNTVAVLKNGNNSAGNVVCWWEADTNTGTATHFGVNGTVILAVGDYLSANIMTGNITFDNNDNWSVTYLG